MKYFKNVTFIIAIAIAIASCKNNAEPEIQVIETKEENATNAVDSNASYAKVEFNIKGMTCAMGCAKTIEKKMAKMEGVKMAKVDFDKEIAMVEYDEAKVSPKSLEETVTKVSKAYKVEDIKKVERFSTEE